jgi:hypothetical protein
MVYFQACNCGCRPCACKLILDVCRIFADLKKKHTEDAEKRLHQELEEAGMKPEFV